MSTVDILLQRPIRGRCPAAIWTVNGLTLSSYIGATRLANRLFNGNFLELLKRSLRAKAPPRLASTW